MLVVERGVEDDLLSWLCRNIAGWNLGHVDRRRLIVLLLEEIDLLVVCWLID